MSSTMRRRSLAGAVLISLVIGGASVAWACTRQPTLSVSPAFGKAGSLTQVTGRSFSPGEPVEIRWNSTGGPVLGRAIGGSFSVAVTIPANAPDGVFYIVATAPTTQSSAAFQVRSAALSSGPEATPQESQTSASASGAESAASNDSGQTSASTRGGNGTATGSSEQSGELGFAEPQTAADTSTSPAPAAQTASAPAGTAAAPRPDRADARTGDVATAGAPANPSSAVSPTPVPNGTSSPALDEQEAASARSASADLWSGFSAGNPGSLTPGLDGGAPANSGTTPPLAVGVGVLSAGMVALGLGFGAAELRRKRALASQGA